MHGNACNQIPRRCSAVCSHSHSVLQASDESHLIRLIYACHTKLPARVERVTMLPRGY